VVLLGVLALEADARRRRLNEGALRRSKRWSSETSRWCVMFPAAATTTLPGVYLARW
jgi:hypothetical protein